MRECYEVDLFAPDPYEISALVISNWAWPGANETAGRERLYLSLCSWFIRDRAEREPEWAQNPQMIRPNQACRSDGDLRRDFRTLNRRIKDRTMVGHVAIAFLQEAETGVVPKLPPGVPRMSANALVQNQLEDRKITDTANFLSRLWRPSRSVLHLCAAWAVIAQEHFKEHAAPLILEKAMRRPDFLALLLHRAQLYESLLERSRLKIRADELIRFRLVRGSKQNRFHEHDAAGGGA